MALPLLLLTLLLVIAQQSDEKKNNIFKIRNSAAGFTLIELLVAMLLTSIVVTLIGSGLVIIMQKNQVAQAESLSQTNINRALNFISDEVRMANTASDGSSTAPAWAWGSNLGTGSPAAKLYLQIPLVVQSMIISNDLINIPNHGFLTGNAVMFTGSGNTAGGVSKNTVYYVIKQDADNFKVARSLANAASNTPIDLITNDSSGSLTGNRLIIYYIRDNTSTWLGAKTINRSVGPCVSPYDQSNCPELVDSIAKNGFTATVTNSRLVNLQLQGQLNDNTPPKTASPVTTSVFVRNN